MRTLQVVVADFAVARFFSLPGAALRPELVDELTNPSARGSDRELTASRPGRMFNRGRGQPQSFDPQLRHKQVLEAVFARSIARRIGRRLAAERNDGLVLVAGPRLLGLIEAQLSKAARRRLAAAVPRDFARLTAAELARQLTPLRAELRGHVSPAA